MRLPRMSALAGSLLVAWLLIAVAAFIVVSRIDFPQGVVFPVDTPFADLIQRISPWDYLLNLVRALLGATVFSAACIATGLVILGAGQEDGADYYAVGATAFLVGEIVFSVIFLSFIVLHGLTRYIVAAVLAAGLLLGGGRTFTFLARRPPTGDFPRRLEHPEKIMVMVLAAVMAIAILYSSALLSYDAVVDYFSTAKLMAVTGRPLYTFAEDLFPVSSFQSGILFASLIQLFGDQAARLLSWVNGLAILLLGLGIAAEAGLSPRARLWFLALVLTTTAFVDLLGDGKVDLISTAPLLAAVYWAAHNRVHCSKSACALVGFLLGFAMIARPYNVVLGAVFLLVFYATFALSTRRQGGAGLRRLVASVVWVLPPMAALGAFHLWQNWLWLGNPLAPLLGARQLSPLAPAIAGAQSGARIWWQVRFDPNLLNTYRLLYPFTVSFINTPQSLGNISPLFVGFFPFLLLRSPRGRLHEQTILACLGVAATATLVGWVALFNSVMEIRYVLFLWIVLFVVFAQLLDNVIDEIGSVFRPLVYSLLTILLAYMGLRALAVAVAAYAPIDSSGQAYCYTGIQCTFLNPLNRTAAAGERVFVLNAFRYYLRPDLFACSSRAQEYGKLEQMAQQNSPGFWTELFREGYRYVTFESNYAIFHTHFGPLPAPASAPDWLHVAQMSSSPDDLERIYRIDAVHPPIEAESYCQKDEGGAWHIKAAISPEQQ